MSTINLDDAISSPVSLGGLGRGAGADTLACERGPFPHGVGNLEDVGSPYGGIEGMCSFEKVYLGVYLELILMPML